MPVGVLLEVAGLDVALIAEMLFEGGQVIRGLGKPVDLGAVAGAEYEAFFQAGNLAKVFSESVGLLGCKGEAFAYFEWCVVVGATKYEEGLQWVCAHRCSFQWSGSQWLAGASVPEAGSASPGRLRAFWTGQSARSASRKRRMEAMA